MRHESLGRGIVLALALNGLACEQPEERIGLRVDDGLSNATFRSAEGGGIWVNNGLTAPEVSGIDPSHPLSDDQGMATEHGILLEPSTRKIARYLVECALPEGATLTKKVGDETLAFQGLVGLAPEWEHGACDRDCQEWVSACLLARTNASGQSVVISIVGDHPAVGMSPAEGFDTYEASFFGNVFKPEGQRAVCRGTGTEVTVANAVGRTCSVDPEACNLQGYDDCELEPRCSFEFNAENLRVAIDCLTDGGQESRTMSVYLSSE